MFNSYVGRFARLVAWFGVSAIVAVIGLRWKVIGWLLCILIPAFFAVLSFRRFRSKQTSNFSVRTAILLLGLVGSFVAIWLQRSCWKQVHQFPVHGEMVAMSPDGEVIAACQGPSIEIRKTKTGEHINTLTFPDSEAAFAGLPRGTRQIFWRRAVFSEDGKSLLTVANNVVRLYDWKSGKLLREWSDFGNVEVGRNGQSFVGIPLSQKEICLYEIDSGQPIFVVPDRHWHQHLVNISPQGNYLLLYGNSTVEVWDVESEKQIGTLRLPDLKADFSTPAFAFSCDETLLAIPTTEQVEIWNVAKCEKVSEWKSDVYDDARTLEWSPDGSRLFVDYFEFIGGDKMIMKPNSVVPHSSLLDRDGNEIAKVTGSNAAFSPTGDRIATVSADVQILDGESGKLLTTLPASRAGESTMSNGPSLYFSPDGDWLIHNGSPSVYRRVRSEKWYSLLFVPAFWGMTVFLTLLAREQVKSQQT